MKLIIYITILSLFVNFVYMEIFLFDLTVNEFNKRNAQYAAKDYIPIAITGYNINETERFSVIWQKNKQKKIWISKISMNTDELVASVNSTFNGYEFKYLTCYIFNDTKLFNVIAVKTNDSQSQSFFDFSFFQLKSVEVNLKSTGFRLIYLNYYFYDGMQFYIAIFSSSFALDTIYKVNMGFIDFQTKATELDNQGYKILSVSSYNNIYAALWELTRENVSRTYFRISNVFSKNIADDYKYQGYVPIYVFASTNNNITSFSTVWNNPPSRPFDFDTFDSVINSYMISQEIVGLSIAVTKFERLVFAKSYGYNDKDNNQPLTLTNSMRIGGASKIYTGLAILKLFEMGKLQSIDCKIFGKGGFLSKYQLPAFNANKLSNMTVRMLLVHGAGLKSCKDEAIFFNSTATPDDVFNYFLNDNTLFRHNPGTVISFSNVGYLFLGKIIEILSNMTYENFINQYILTPLDIETSSTFIGNADGSISKPIETLYYPPYNVNVKLWGPFNGWSASVIDLAKLIVSMDGSSIKPDVFNSTLLKELTTTYGSYATGIRIVNSTYGQNGCAGSSRSLVWKYTNDITYSVVMNSKPKSDTCCDLFKLILEKVLNSILNLPSNDMF